MAQSITKTIFNQINQHKHIIAITGILIIAAILRFSGYNWDGLYSLHPDERSIVFAIAKIDFLKGQLDPDFFAYGTLPIYLIKIISDFLKAILPSFDIGSQYILIGRLISATAGVLSILFVYLLSNKLYGRTVAVLSSLFLTLTVSQIQYSHFATVDVLLTLFIIITLYLLTDIYDAKATTQRYILVGISIGIALAIKISAAPLVVVFIICHGINVYKLYKDLKAKNTDYSSKAFKELIKFAFLTPIYVLLITLIVNFLAQPYAYIRFPAFLDRIQSELKLAKYADACYTQQYVGSTFLFYYLKEIIQRCMGAPLGILAIISLVIAIVESILKPKTSRHIILLLWVIPYFITINTYEAKFLRYLQPLFPFLCIFAGYYFVKLVEYLKNTNLGKFIAVIISLILIGYTLFYALAFFSIYMRPHTFITGSKWFYKNVPNNSFILSQHWDEGFPLNIKSKGSKEFEKEDLELYEHFGCNTEDRRKSDYLAEYLVKGDYIVAQTRRLYGAVATVNDRYPITSKYFDLLFTNKLGFKPVKEFNSYPSLLGVEFNDDLGDESFSVYDHPKILIFKKDKNYSKQEYINMLESKDENVLTKDQLLSFHQDRKQHESNFSITDEIVIIGAWWLLFEFLSALGLILSFIIFKKKAPSSIFYSYLLGLLGFSYCVWVLVSCRFISYSFPFILFIFVVLLATAAGYVYQHKTQVFEYVKENIDTIFISKIAFLSCFIIFLLIRTQTPEIYWGEKPMDFGIFNNLIRVSQLPPDEIWFSGKALNYYYYGHFMFATLAKLTFIPSYFAYNLSIATISALTFCSAVGILYLLTNSYFYGILSGVITVFWANLSGIRELIFGEHPIGFDFYWATSRVIPHTINEYPLWTILFGDLHAHVIVMPIFIFLIYLSLYLFNTTTSKELICWPVALLTSFTIGAIAVTNTWDFPGASCILILGIITALFYYYQEKIKSLNLSIIFKNLLIILACIALSFLWFLPYWLTTKSASVLSFGVLPKEQSVIINDYLFIWGFFLYIFFGLFVYKIYYKIKPFLSKAVSDNNSTIIGICFILLLLVLQILSTSISTITFTSLFALFSLITFIITKEPMLKAVCCFIFTGTSMTLFAESFYIIDHMNTIFKLFLEVWYIFTFSAIYVLFYLFKEFIPAFKNKTEKNKRDVAIIWLIPFVLLASLSMFTIYTAVVGYCLTNRVPTPYTTINGLSYLKYKNISEYQAIEWLNKNIKGTPTLLEAHGELYGDYSRIAMNTGLPTVVGWDHHLNQRAVPQSEIDKRAKDIETIYSTPNANLAYDLLSKYQIKLIYISWLEARKYDPEGFTKFDKNPSKFKLIYSNKDVKIYKVLY